MYNYTKEREEELYESAKTLLQTKHINNLIDVFKIDIPNDIIVEKFYIRTVMLMITYNDSFTKIDNVEFEKTLFGAKCKLQPFFNHSIIEDVTEVCFENIYPIIAINGDEFSNIVNYKDMLYKLYGEINDPYKNNLIDLNIIKDYTNNIFGIMNNTNKDAYIKSIRCVSYVIETTKNIMNSIEKEFLGNVIYEDTNLMYFCNFNEIKDRLNTKLNEILNIYDYLNINITPYKNGIFIREKTYILNDLEGNTKTIGLKKL